MSGAERRALPNTSRSRWWWPRIGVGSALIVLGIASCRRAFNIWGADLAQLYMSAKLFLEGNNVYDLEVQRQGYAQHIGEITTWGHFYPPGSAIALVPMTVVSYPVARQLWFVLGIVALIGGLWYLMKTYVPSWDASVRVVVIGLVLCSSCVRWGFQVAQPTAIVVGLFGVFLAEFKTKRQWIAFVCAAIVGSIKFTFGIPFVLLAIFQRRFRLAALLCGFWALTNIVATLRMGGLSILEDYRANMEEFERADQLNYPDPRGFNSLARTDWPYVLNAIDADFERNNLIGHALTLLTVGWLAWEVWRARERAIGDVPLLALSGPVAAVSMLAVYHHHYDIGLLLVPLIAYVGTPQLRRLRSAWIFVIPVGLYAGVYPYQAFPQFVEPVLGDRVWVTKVLASVVCILALVGSCIAARSILRSSRADSQPPVEPLAVAGQGSSTS